MIHHQWPLEVTDVTSIGFLIGETPTYKLSSTFKAILCLLIAKKAKIPRRKIPSFQVALTVVRAHTLRPTTKTLVREACTAFELQVPVDQQRAMEELLKNFFWEPQPTIYNSFSTCNIMFSLRTRATTKAPTKIGTTYPEPPCNVSSTRISNDDPGPCGNSVQSLSRNSRVTKSTSAARHTVSSQKESLSKCTDLQVASL
jgi:hypothetical protein